MTALDDGSSGPCQCAPCRERAQRLPARTAHQLKRLDLTKPPAPILRHTGILIIAIIYCALGAPTALGDWLWAAVLAGFLAWPDITGFTIGGIRLDLKQAKDDIKQAKDDITALRNDVNAQARASSTATIALGNDALTTVTQALAQTTLQVASDLATGLAVPYSRPGTGSQT
ncbi:MAG TPA: hypothetical protein VFQ68_34995, partial [Streptosporangiaceae bacterium]|nr:hypothetical protein [Streptosporangiaceae bacterium]